MPHKKGVVFRQKVFKKGVQCCVCYIERKFLSPNAPVRNPTVATARIRRFRRINLCGPAIITETIIVIDIR
jgi:hypothetical protein